jgi:Fe-S-cluster containining protein
VSGAAADRYRRLLERLDAWFAAGSRAHPGVVPCRSGCSACCHGPFDISVADAALLARGLAKLAAADRADVLDRARALLGQARALEPGWAPPFDIAALGGEEAAERRFDAISDALAAEPCPLLNPAGRCRVYEDRPLVCRLIGLPMATPAGRVIENACPIRHEFPAYAALAPAPFDLEGFEEEELDCFRAAARELFGPGGALAAFAEPGSSGEERLGFETFIAALVAAVAG